MFWLWCYKSCIPFFALSATKIALNEVDDKSKYTKHSAAHKGSFLGQTLSVTLELKLILWHKYGVGNFEIRNENKITSQKIIWCVIN